MKKTVRKTVEMAICYSNGTWQAGQFVEVEDPGCGCCDGPDDWFEAERLEKLGREVLQKQLDANSATRLPTGIDVTGMWLYHYGNEEEEGGSKPLRRSEVRCVLFFKMDEITVGSEIEQQAAAIEQVNLALQRQPYGLGAKLEKSP